MTITRIEPPLIFETPLGLSSCHFVWEGGKEADVEWCCFLIKTGEAWWWKNNQIRMTSNISSGRYNVSKIYETKEMTKALAPHRKRQGKI